MNFFPWSRLGIWKLVRVRVDFLNITVRNHLRRDEYLCNIHADTCPCSTDELDRQWFRREIVEFEAIEDSSRRKTCSTTSFRTHTRSFKRSWISSTWPSRTFNTGIDPWINLDIQFQTFIKHQHGEHYRHQWWIVEVRKPGKWKRAFLFEHLPTTFLDVAYWCRIIYWVRSNTECRSVSAVLSS